ncbi:DUF6608 family protein [Clostridium sp. UBA4548]|uniref:DUF6608 family protein n=1 Tax=Clostridium sp. UBA4548 TaxID=1946361 RepID=UPI0025B807E1|nr:DUF6608 family protein [Clostridium sp. UBA4548]
MKSKIIKELKGGFIFFSVIYTIITILSSSEQLFQGQVADTNFHILNRAVVTFIAVLTVKLFEKIKVKSAILSFLLPYAISMGVVFFYVWLTAFIEPLSRNAYRDVFFNFTAISICVALILTIKDKWKKKKRKGVEDFKA